MNNHVTNKDSMSKFKIMLIIFLVSFGSAVLFQIIYFRFSFYETMMTSLNINNAQLGATGGIYGLVATICYLPGGIIADKIRAKYLAAVGFFTTAAVLCWFATLPSYTSVMIIFALLGVTSTLIFWGIRYKLVRLVSDDATYSRNIGLSYGIYGVGGLLLGFVSQVIFNSFAGNDTAGFIVVLITSVVLNVIFGVATLLFVPKFDDEIKTGQSFNLNEFKEAITHPGVWLTTASMFFVYCAYAAMAYTTPYLTDIFGASMGITSTVGMIRTYGIALLSAPIIGSVATRINSPAKVLVLIMALTAVCSGILILLPTGPAMLMIAIVLILAVGFFLTGAYGVASSQFSESGVPTTIFGAATGILSVIAFIPDMFVPVITGNWLDAYPGMQGYQMSFGFFLIAASVIAVLCSIALRIYVKKKNPSPETPSKIAE
ncbi:MAG: MFS transporter [Eubacterium sp.]